MALMHDLVADFGQFRGPFDAKSKGLHVGVGETRSVTLGFYSDAATREWVVKGCTSAGIGCLDCKQPVIDAINREQDVIRERAQRYLDDPTLVRNIVADGCEKARKLAQETMRDVREAMGLNYT